MPSKSLTFKQTIRAPLHIVYNSFINATKLREWLCDVSTTMPHPDGRLYLWWNSGYYTAGEFTSIEKDARVSFTWRGRGDPAATEVTVAVSPQEKSTQLIVTHSGLGTGPKWSSARKEIKKGWKLGLENLKSVLEKGEDLRFVRRPMMGIGINEFSEEIAKYMGIPVSEGIRLSSVVEGMGAQQAGLQMNDVIVEIDNQPTGDYEQLVKSLQAHRSGDKVEVIFYRGAEKKTVTMELSRRPIPEIPMSYKGLADVLSKKYAGFQKSLDELFQGVTEAEASFKLTPEEWSVKENLAHLIHSERETQGWISDLTVCQERTVDDFSGNVNARGLATIAVYPTLTELRAEFQRSYQETIALITNLPADFSLQKASYWRMAYQTMEGDFHIQSHLDQMRAAIQAARK